MPYVIAVLALVVISVGFTLFQAQDNVAIESTEPTSMEGVQETVNTLIATDTPSLPIDILTTSLPTIPENTPTEVPQTHTPAATPTPSPAPSTTAAPAITTDYKNGSYATQSSYRTPDGTYQISVDLTIVNDKITNSTVSFDSKGARDGYSKRFSNSYQSAVIGQDLGTASLSRVGGASLTTKAFNSALEGIRSQAAS